MYFEYYAHSRSSIAAFLSTFLCSCSVIVAVLIDAAGDLSIESGLASICVLGSSVFDHGVAVGMIWRSFRSIRIGIEAVIAGCGFSMVLIELGDSSMLCSASHSLLSKIYIYSLLPRYPNSLISDCLS